MRSSGALDAGIRTFQICRAKRYYVWCIGNCLEVPGRYLQIVVLLSFFWTLLNVFYELQQRVIAKYTFLWAWILNTAFDLQVGSENTSNAKRGLACLELIIFRCLYFLQYWMREKLQWRTVVWIVYRCREAVLTLLLWKISNVSSEIDEHVIANSCVFGEQGSWNLRVDLWVSG